MVYSVSDKNSFKEVATWVHELQQYTTPDVKLLLVGNKADLQEERLITTEEGVNLATTLKMSFLETSAKSSHNVNLAFSMMAKQMHEVHLKSFMKMDGTLTSANKIIRYYVYIGKGKQTEVGYGRE